jgi:hypothetical protein
LCVSGLLADLDGLHPGLGFGAGGVGGAVRADHRRFLGHRPLVDDRAVVVGPLDDLVAVGECRRRDRGQHRAGHQDLCFHVLSPK